MSIKSNNSSNYQSNDKKQVATLFMHGYGGTNNSEKYMVNQVRKKCYKGCSYKRMFYLTEKFSLVAKFQRSLRIQL